MRADSPTAPADGARDAEFSVLPTIGGAATEPGGEPKEARLGQSSLPRWLAGAPSWLASMVLHIGLVLILALWTLAGKPPGNSGITLGVAETATEGMELGTLDSFRAEAPAPALATVPIGPPTTIEPTEAPALETLAPPLPTSETGLEAARELTAVVDAGVSNGFAGRGEQMRGQLLAEAGGTPGSEAAVERALKWFAAHQRPDGSWNFFHQQPDCDCPDHGSLEQAQVGATAMALLPFLGAGHTHLEGEYRDVVKQGLYFITSSQGPDGALVESGGNMYSHGLASIALCEAYAMSGDRGLQRPAQGAVDFICAAQDPYGGGWRYRPREPGDTSVVGWQLMALKSGHMAYLAVPSGTIAGVRRFLDSVQTNEGATYGYLGPGERPATSAIGLLCRMYLGWDHEHTALSAGIEHLSELGPSPQDMYYNYYATQVMRHYGGPHWEKWNKQMRDWLVRKQEKRGHVAGSWFIESSKPGETAAGGRIYCTSLATMILEVYYRHLPLYSDRAAADEFPL